MSDGGGLSKDARGALAGRLLLDMLAVLPSTSCLLHLSPEEIARREAQGQAIGEQLHNLVAGQHEDEA